MQEGLQNFLKIVTKADNIPIVAMVFIVGSMTWWMLREAARNDRLVDAGESDKIYDRMNCWVWGEKDEEGE